MRKHTFLIAAMVAALAAAVAVAFWLERRGPPEPARLLPPAEAYFYVNVRPLRAASVFRKLPEVKLDPEYQEFVRQTGIQPGRDLDQAAFAIHTARASAAETRYSEVFVGRYDAHRLRSYMEQAKATREEYRGVEVFAIPLPGRTLRVAMLGPERVSVSNAGPEAIHWIIDRAKEFSLRLRGPDLLRDYHRHIPWGSVAWLIARLAPTGGEPRSITLPGGFQLPTPAGTVLVASLRYTGTIDFKAEAFTPSEADAQRLSDQLGAYAALVRTLQAGTQTGPVETELKALLESLHVETQGERVTLTLSVPSALLEKIFAVAPTMTAPPTRPEQKPAPKPQPRRRR